MFCKRNVQHGILDEIHQEPNSELETESSRELDTRMKMSMAKILHEVFWIKSNKTCVHIWNEIWTRSGLEFEGITATKLCVSLIVCPRCCSASCCRKWLGDSFLLFLLHISLRLKAESSYTILFKILQRAVVFTIPTNNKFLIISKTIEYMRLIRGFGNQ